MKGTALLLLCAATLAQADPPQLTLNGKVCNCNPGEANNVCSKNGSDGQLIVHENCNQFYKCFHGSAVAYYCPANLVYNPLAEICDWSENVACGDRPIVDPNTEKEDCSQENSNNGNEGSGGHDNNGGTDDGNNIGICNCDPEEAPALCSADGSNGVLVAHQNCNQFYKCDHGIPVTLNCPSGLRYNAYIEQCDWAHNVECGDRPIVEIGGSGDNNSNDEDCEDSGNGNDGSGSEDDGSGDNGGTCNCNPGEAPGICGADGSEGTLIAHENCNQFYKCSHGLPVALFCPAGLLYNPRIERCDWPALVECGDRPIVDGGNGDNGDGDNGGGDNDGGDNGGGDNGGGDNGGTCNCNPGEAPGICGADGSEGTLIAHENCNQFYKCSHGLPVALFCPAGLLYNPHIERCDWPALVECGDRPIVDGGNGDNGDGDNGGGDNGGGDNGGGDNGGGDNGGGDNGGGDNGGGDNGGTCNCNPGEAPGICGADGSEGTLIAHENCNQFYKCSHGLPVALFCPAGLLYNPHIERCDWPALVECGDRPIVDGGNGDNGDCDNGGGDNGGGDNGGGDNGGGDNGGGDNGGGDNGGTCNCSPGEAPGICGAGGSEGTLIAHENCNQFYKCSHGLPVALFCPAGLLYNPHIERCDWPALVECGDRPIVDGGNGDNGDGDNGGGDNGGGDNGGGDNGGGDNGGGDNGGGDNGGTCNCNPGEAPGICGADGSEGTLIAHENCNQFYKCSHGLPVALFCPAGLLYNPHIERCDWPALVECGDRPIVDGGNGDNGDGDNGGGDNGGGDNGGGDNGGGDNGGGDNGGGDNGGTCNCNPGEAPGICGANGSEGTLIAHENCNQFYKCSHGLPVALFCPAGLLYNPHIERCDWPALVECGDRPIVDGGNGDNGDGDNGGGDNGGGDNGGGDNGGGDNGGGDNGGGDNGGTCNCNPGEAPGICGTDGSEGTLIAHENCNQFYKCSHGLPVALFCPAGLLYNPRIERCDWPALVECGDRPIVDGGNGDNGDGDNGGGDNGGGDNGGGDNGGGDNGGGDNGGGDNGGTCNCNPGEAPGICGADGSEGTLIAHENCNQFYKCSHGLPVALFCPAGLLYNPHIERCDWPALVECGDRPIVDGGNGDNGDGDNGGGDNGGGDNGGGDNGGGDNGGGDNGGGDNGGTCNCNPGEAPGICGADGSEGTLIAHENCNQFYKCSHGLPVALFCPAGLLYNPRIERCDWPALVECGDRPIVDGGNGDNGDGDNGGGDNGGGDNGGGDNGGGDNGGGDNGGGDNGGTCNCNPGEAPGICGADGSEGTLIAHENCNQFYKCSHGLPVALFCPAGLLYNPRIERCDWPALVECGDRPIVDGGNGDNGDGDNGGGDNGGGDNGGGDNGGGDNGGGDNGGGDNGGTCNCNPGEAPAICGADGSEGTLIAHENCNQFYKCSHGLPVALFCPAGLLYNPHIERCDWPALVECGDRPVVDGGNGDNGNGDNGGGDNGGGDNGGGDNGDGDNGGTCNCNPGKAPGICAADGSEGTLIAHENCNQFYKCSHGLPVALLCPEGLHYDPHIERCDWASLVACGDRHIVDGGNGDNGDGNNGGGDNGGGDNGGGDNGGGDSGDNCDPSQAPSICTAPDSDGVLVAHENCNQFYKCSEGVPVALNCPSGLLYNSIPQICDWPYNVECGDRVQPKDEEGDNNGGGDNSGGDNNGGDNGSSGGNGDPSEAPAICANAGSNGVLVAHEKCDQFYVCSYGEPVALSCPSNLLYNPDTEECDWPKNVECGYRVIPEPESIGDIDAPCSCNSREAPSICARSESNGKLIAHENCNQYYVCFKGVPVARSCPRNLFYDPHTERCLWPVAVSCEGRVITVASNYASLNKHTQARRGFF